MMWIMQKEADASKSWDNYHCLVLLEARIGAGEAEDKGRGSGLRQISEVAYSAYSQDLLMLLQGCPVTFLHVFLAVRTSHPKNTR